jgi:Rod binding domain-containing protein
MDKTMITQAQAAFSAGAAKPPAVRAGMNIDQIKKTAEEFEAFYLAQALEPMFAGVEPAEPFSGGPGEDMWRSMQVQEYGKALAKNGGVGLADSVVREMLRMQETGGSPAP